MKIVKRKISELKSSEYNPRRLTKEQERHLTASLSEFGLVDPVIVNINPERKDIIIGGHQRLKVWRKLGHKDIDCVELDLPIEKERELNIRLNANTGEWNKDLLEELFQIEELQDWGLNLEWYANEKVEAEIKFATELDSESNYIVLKFSKDIDWIWLQSILEIESVYSKRANGKPWSKGVGRVVDGMEAIEKFKNS